jgi:ABC-type Fe3+/spermidine/putrescine transport system ATPase subunit
MLDEPLGSLDRALRERLMLEIRQILKQVGLTAIYVTHDQTEAFAVADRVIVMSRGQIEQASTPEQLYRFPATPFVARFLGFTNLVEATCLPDGALDTPLGVLPMSYKPHTAGEKVTVLIRPEAATLQDQRGIPVQAEVLAALFRGRFYQLIVVAGGQKLTFELPLLDMPQPGQTLALWLDPAAISVLEGPSSGI